MEKVPQISTKNQNEPKSTEEFQKVPHNELETHCIKIHYSKKFTTKKFCFPDPLPCEPDELLKMNNKKKIIPKNFPQFLERKGK